MVFKFKYKFIKNIINEYIDIHKLGLDINDSDVYITIVIDKSGEFSIYINKHEDHIIFSGDDRLTKMLVELEKKINVSKILDYILEDETVRLFDSETDIYITKVLAFDVCVVLIGDRDYIVSIPVSDCSSGNDDIIVGLLRYEESREFPCELNIGVSLDIYSRLPDSLKELEYVNVV